MTRRFVLYAIATAVAACGDPSASTTVRDVATPSHAASAAQASQSAGPARLPPSAEVLSDPLITARVQERIARDPALQGADVSITTQAGIVTLTGTVASQEQAAIASAHAQHDDGVLRVDNHLAANLR